MPVYMVLVLLAIGAIVGWLGRRIFGKVGPFGMTGDIIIGAVGALILGYLLAVLVAASDILLVVIAVVGALLLLWIVRKVKR